MNPAGTERTSSDPPALSPPKTPGAPGTKVRVTGSPAQQRQQRPWAAILVKAAPAAIPALVMASLGLWGLSRDSALANDEAATRIAAQLSLTQLAHLLRHIDAVHGLYYLFMQGWAYIGTSPALLRVPSLLAMIAAVVMSSLLATRLTSSGWVGLFAGLIMALTPSISYYAQTARSYAFVSACVVGATLALVAVLRAETTG